tara:strand:+ start:1417 stop:2091 length:675 start_codon:yes stop_codon:yes gene_type:complete
VIDKYFGFKTISDEVSIVDSLIEHTRIDEEELHLLSGMVSALCAGQSDEIENYSSKIMKIRSDSNRVFEHTEEQIIRAHFDFQKQYDLLRIYRRIEGISGSILNASDRILILSRIHGHFPKEFTSQTTHFVELLTHAHELFKQSLIDYEHNKKDVIQLIHRIAEVKQSINNHFFNCIEKLYKFANDETIPLGNFRAIETIYQNLNVISTSIEDASNSLEWLLIY